MCLGEPTSQSGHAWTAAPVTSQAQASSDLDLPFRPHLLLPPRTVLLVMRLMSKWSLRKRTVVIFCLGLGSVVLTNLVEALTGSRVVQPIVDLVLIVLLGWVIISFFRLSLRDHQEDVKKNPKPW